jgi:hypothetical protein
MSIALMISNYFHDLSVALLASNVVVVYLLGKFLDESQVREKAMSSVFKKLSYLTYGALAYVILAGAVRAYFFMDFEWNPAVGNGQVSALVLKHIILVSLTVFGIATHRKYQRRYGV